MAKPNPFSWIRKFTACVFFLIGNNCGANLITANSSNYTSYLNTLVAGDTLYLTAGTYSNNLTLNNLTGDSLHPIVIMGDSNLYSTIFNAQSCCNTVSITMCSFVIIKNLKLDGLNLFVDAVKAEGTNGNFAGHITLEYLYIVNYGADQQNVGISTKCHAWDWIIRKNIIIGAGTGLYLGNSNGDKPFVNGIIENNLVMNTVGYNMEIKHQLDTVRDNFAGTNVDGKTIIRYNVFCKDSGGATGLNARPNVLVGAFPSAGAGSNDYYEIYGNFFYQNPDEALIQLTGNTALYDNVFVNHYDPPGYRAVYITSQNGFQPRSINVFHNTVWVANSSGGIRLYDPNTSYQQYCYANAVFATSPVTNFMNSQDNITDSYSNATNYFLNASTNLNSLDLYPRSGQLTGMQTPDSLFNAFSNYDKDFNGDLYDWTYRGAYSGCCINNGWHLQLDTMNTPLGTITTVRTIDEVNDFIIYPNPVESHLYFSQSELKSIQIDVLEMNGGIVKTIVLNGKSGSIDVAGLSSGIYIIRININNEILNYRMIKI
jgi:hypothetical protein